MNYKELFESFKREFGRRKFVGGLLLAYIELLRELDAFGKRFHDFEAFLQRFPAQTTTAQGKTANTLIIALPGAKQGRTLSLRPFYNRAESFFRVEHKRFDFPNCAPHATQAWRDYEEWITTLLRCSPQQIAWLEQHVTQFVLDTLPSHEPDIEGLTPLEQRFSQLLRDFSLKGHKGEPPGAAFQGIVYAYIRADAPHLHLDISKVGAGSKRLQRVGDIDGWEGERLVLSAEVKNYSVSATDVEQFTEFASQVSRRKAMGLVAAHGFADVAAIDLEGLGLRTVERDSLIRLVDL